MLPIGEYEDVAAGGGVSVCVCVVYGLFKGLFESMRCVFGECKGCAWPGRVGEWRSAKAGIFGVV